MSEAFGSMESSRGEIELRQDNVALFQHIGKYALFDHVFVRSEEAEGYFFWREHPCFETLQQAAAANGCEMHLNLPEVADVDERMFMMHALQDIGDTIPEDWGKID